MMNDDPGPDDIVVVPIEDSIDLHTFQPREVKDLLDDYLRAAMEKGFREVTVIHGKGTGVLRERVHSVLRKHPRVVGFKQAEAVGGGWGATVVSLKMEEPASARSDHR
ncbi:MAG: Smr/MutS family protein [Syntrophobacteraceae bacterium]